MSAGAPRRKKHKEPEEHINHERWMVTYADMLTLLMVLFIIMFAISQVDQKKFEQLKEGLAAGFSVTSHVVEGSDSLLTNNANDKVPFDPHTDLVMRPDVATQLASDTTARLTGSNGVAQAAENAQALGRVLQAANMAKAKAGLSDSLRKAGLSNDVQVVVDSRGLVVSLITDKALFPADRATLAPVTRRLLDTIAPALQDLPNDVAVEGHTNTVPVRPKYYPTEWELSSARAVAVARYLIARGVPEGQIQATGFGDTRPLLPRSDPRSTAANRRVDIVVLADLSLVMDTNSATAGSTGSAGSTAASGGTP